MWREISPRILFTGKDFLSVEATVVHQFRPSVPREDWTGEGRGRGKTAIFLLFPTQSPLLLPGVAPPLSRQNPGGTKWQKGIWEKRLYQVLILWLFLQFLNFKWEYWNTDIDMKRFIVTIYHYYHRPYCYYRFREFLASAVGGWDAVSVFSDCSEDNRAGYIYINICIRRYFWTERCILSLARHS